jgi:hypothetical protein
MVWVKGNSILTSLNGGIRILDEMAVGSKAEA